MKQTTEIQALQNSADYLNIGALKVIEWYSNDKRKTNKKYYLTLEGTTISPVLDYEQMNHFLLGMHRMKEIAD